MRKMKMIKNAPFRRFILILVIIPIVMLQFLADTWDALIGALDEGVEAFKTVWRGSR